MKSSSVELVEKIGASVSFQPVDSRLKCNWKLYYEPKNENFTLLHISSARIFTLETKKKNDNEYVLYGEELHGKVSIRLTIPFDSEKYAKMYNEDMIAICPIDIRLDSSDQFEFVENVLLRGLIKEH